MFRRLTLILLAALALHVHAEEFVSDQYGFSIVLPSGESWTRGNIQPLGYEAEMIYSAVNMESREGLLVTIIPRIPTGNIMNEAVISKIIEVLNLQGFSVLRRAPRQINGMEFLEFIAQRTDETSAKLIAVCRAIMRDRTVFITTFFGRGDEDRVMDARFLRVVDTFRFLDEERIVTSPLVDPMHGYYHGSYIACLAAAGALALLFGVVLFRTRKRAFE